MLRFGTDKPDLRNPLELTDAGAAFDGSGFRIFAELVKKGGVVRALRAPGAASQPRSFFDKLNEWARGEGMPGLGYVVYGEGLAPEGPIARNLEPERAAELARLAGAEAGDAVFLVAGPEREAAGQGGLARDEVAARLGLVEEGSFRFCWIVDFPMYEPDPETGAPRFSHNPFSMPQGGLEAFRATPSRCLRGSTTSSATAWSSPRGLSATTCRDHVPRL